MTQFLGVESVRDLQKDLSDRFIRSGLLVLDHEVPPTIPSVFALAFLEMAESLADAGEDVPQEILVAGTEAEETFIETWSECFRLHMEEQGDHDLPVQRCRDFAPVFTLQGDLPESLVRLLAQASAKVKAEESMQFEAAVNGSARSTAEADDNGGRKQP